MYDGVVVAKDVSIPLMKRERNPGKYDLIYSLSQLPMLKKYQIRKISKYESVPGFAKTNVAFSFDREARDNLLSEKEVNRISRAYSETGSNKRVITLVIDTMKGQDETVSRFECAFCQSTATLADVRLNLTFCGQTCWENY